MSDHDDLITYIQDHLAGARFALSLLEDLSGLAPSFLAAGAQRLHAEIERDRVELEKFLKRMGSEISYSKEFTSWIAQKASRLKLSLSTPFGRFEAVETLTLGVLGKVALWRALQAIELPAEWSADVDLPTLIRRAQNQHRQLERFRLQLAKEAFRRSE
jgi:hypothetical protein